MITDFLLGVCVGVILTLVSLIGYRVYQVLACKYALERMKNQLQAEFLEARRQILDQTIQQLEDHANEED